MLGNKHTRNLITETGNLCLLSSMEAPWVIVQNVTKPVLSELQFGHEF